MCAESIPPALSVIVPCFNAARTVGETLEALVSQRWDLPWEIVVVDNRSSDGSREVVKRFVGGPVGVRLVTSRPRRRRSVAINDGIIASRGGAIAVCDADDVPASGWVEAIGEALRDYPFVASRYEWRRLNTPELTRVRGEPQTDGLMRLWYPPFVRHAGGSGQGVRREILDRHGYYDESIPSCQDTEMCIRLQLAGVPLRFVPGAVLHMRCRGTPLQNLRQAKRWATWNQVLHARYRRMGPTPERPWRELRADWHRIARQLRACVRVRDHHSVCRLAWTVGWQLGLLEGSARTRVPPYPYPRAKDSAGNRRVTSAAGGTTPLTPTPRWPA